MNEELTEEGLQRRKKTRTILIIMLLLFSAPYIASFLLYNYGDYFNLGTTNYGKLLNPRVPLDSLDFQGPNHKKVNVNGYKGKWVLLAFGSSVCEDPCKASLFKMRQIRKLMAVDRAWIRRVYVITDTEGLDGLREFMRDYEGTDIFSMSDQTIKNIEQQLNLKKDTFENRMMLIDPVGDIILLYPQDPDPKGVYGDIKKLFKVTKRE